MDKNLQIGELRLNVWLPARLAARKIGCSTDTIERRGIPWQSQPVPYRVRYKYLILGEGSDAIRAYFEADLEALVVTPDNLPLRSRPRFVPKFRAGQATQGRRERGKE